MTALVTARSGGSALAAAGDGLVSCATNEKSDRARMMIMNTVTFILYPLFLKAVSAVERDAVLGVVAERNIGILLRKLIPQSEGNMGGKLIANGNGAAVTMQMLVDKPNGVIGILKKHFGRKQGITN